MKLSRRNFLKASAPAFALPLLGGRLSTPVHAFSARGAAGSAVGHSDRILVIIQLMGGNDGLNTVINLDRMDLLAKHRPNLYIPDSKALKLNATTGLHPSMTGMQNLFKDGKLCIVQGVGYPDPNESHFRSSDIIWTGSAGTEYFNEGWLGRFLQGDFAGYPVGYPKAGFADPPAIMMGPSISPCLYGTTGSMALTVKDPNQITDFPERDIAGLPNTPPGNELRFVRTLARQTEAYSTVVKNAASKGVNKAVYPAKVEKYSVQQFGFTLTEQLQVIAKLISGGLKTRVYVASVDGFDTHGGQVAEGDSTKGAHADMLADVTACIAAFQEDLRLQGLEDKVMGMVHSEFGRRIMSNGSLGTDHGHAQPMLFFGKPVQGGIVGNSPVLPEKAAWNSNLPMERDYRSVYATVLKNWLGGSDAAVKNAVKRDFPLLPIVASAQVGLGSLAGLRGSLLEQNAPNPVRDHTWIRYRLDGSAMASLKVLDMRGRTVQTLFEGRQGAGRHEAFLDAARLMPGTYVYRLSVDGKVFEKTFNRL